MTRTHVCVGGNLAGVVQRSQSKRNPLLADSEQRQSSESVAEVSTKNKRGESRKVRSFLDQARATVLSCYHLDTSTKVSNDEWLLSAQRASPTVLRDDRRKDVEGLEGKSSSMASCSWGLETMTHSISDEARKSAVCAVLVR